MEQGNVCSNGNTGRVDRELFLRGELRPYCTKEQMEKALVNPVEVISKDRIDALANACINNHTEKLRQFPLRRAYLVA